MGSSSAEVSCPFFLLMSQGYYQHKKKFIQIFECSKFSGSFRNCKFIEKARVPEKHLLYWLSKAFECVDHNKLENSSRDGNTNHLNCLLRNLYTGQKATVRSSHGTKDWFQIGKGVRQSVYCHPAYLTYLQSTLWKTPDWMKHKLESRLLGEIAITSDMQMTPP